MKRFLMFASVCVMVISIPTAAQTIPDGVVINRVTWATRNVDAPGTFAENPEDFGLFYQFDSPAGWSTTTGQTLIRTPLIAEDRWYYGYDRYPKDMKEFTGDPIWTADNDPCPPGWTVPTQADFILLAGSNHVAYTWVERNGVQGGLFTDTLTGESVFFPAVGLRDNDKEGRRSSTGRSGYYWSMHANIDPWHGANYLLLVPGKADPNAFRNRNSGLSVRCVQKEATGRIPS